MNGGGGLWRCGDKGLELGRGGALEEDLGTADGCCAGRGGPVGLGAFALWWGGTEGLEVGGGIEPEGFRIEQGGERGKGGEVDFWGFTGVGVTEMSTNWTDATDGGEEEQSESKEDGVVGLGMTVGDVAAAGDSMVHI